MQEIWKPINGYEGIYDVSNFGRVRRGERTLKPCKNGSRDKRYYMVMLSKNDNKKNKRIHRLVAEAFVGPPQKDKVVDHIDNNPLNNNASNLQYITNRENCSKDQTERSSKYVGVSWDKSRRKWISSIRINGKSKSLGRFDDELKAAKAYQDKLLSISSLD